MNGMMLQFLQQLNGQNFYYYYGDTFFKSAGTQLSPYIIQTILGAVSVFGTVPVSLLKAISLPSASLTTLRLCISLKPGDVDEYVYFP
jgi:hypothetical protein